MSATVAAALKKIAIYILGDAVCADREYRRWVYRLDVFARSCTFKHGKYGS